MILVSIGGFFGAIARFWVSNKLNKLSFPFGTLFVNAAGAFLLGMLIGINPGENGYLLAGTGFLGAFTTFSTWLFEVKKMELQKGAFYLVFTCAAGFFGVWIVL